MEGRLVNADQDLMRKFRGSCPRDISQAPSVYVMSVEYRHIQKKGEKVTYVGDSD
jgi:hypothetical protein